MKTCKGCSKDKELEDFPKNSKLRDGRGNKCKTCMNEYHRERKKRTNIETDEGLTTYLGYKIANIQKQDARKFPEHAFDLTVQDLRDIYFRQNKRCIYSNSKLSYGRNTSIYKKISFDRINNDLPHTKTNLQMTSIYMNMFRNNKTDEEFRELINSCQ